MEAQLTIQGSTSRPDQNRYTLDEESLVLDHAADEFNFIKILKLPTRLLRHASVVCTNLEKKETKPLTKICFVKRMDDVQEPEKNQRATECN